MFNKMPKFVDTTLWGSYYGKGTIVKVEHTTPFRTKEAILIRQLLEKRPSQNDYVPPFNIIGDTNLVITDDNLIIDQKPLFNSFRSEFKGNDLYVGFCLHLSLNSKLFGYKKYGEGIYFRPIIEAPSGQVRTASDITSILGLQLLSRDNVEHNGYKPIIVKGFSYTENFKQITKKV